MKTPFPITLRELWLPTHIRGTQLPPSAPSGRALTLTGATKGTTSDGVRCIMDNNSYITLGALHNAAAKFWVSFRVKMNALTSGQYVFSKRVDDSNRFQIYWAPATGRFHGLLFIGAAGPDLESTVVIADTLFHHCLLSCSDVNGFRFLVDGVAVTSPATLSPLPNGGDIVFNSFIVAGGLGVECTISDVCMGTDDLTAAEELDLYKGIPPADAVHVYTSDEGRGLTIVDRGTGGNNGTLGATAAWAYGQVRAPVLSLDGINDYAASASGVSIAGDLTLVWVGKMKSTYTALAGLHMLVRHRIDVSNLIYFDYESVTDNFRFFRRSGASNVSIDDAYKPAIDEYLIFIATFTAAGAMALYRNGSLVVAGAGTIALPGLPATSYIGSTEAPDFYDVSKPLYTALIEGALTAAQVKTYSRWLRDRFNMLISI